MCKPENYTRGQTYWRVAKFALLSFLTLIVFNDISLLLENGNNERPVMTIFDFGMYQLLYLSSCHQVVKSLTQQVIKPKHFHK
jgi:hypothetical protein